MNNNDISNRFELMDLEKRTDIPHEDKYSFNSDMELNERAKINRKYQHSRAKKAPDYHQPIESRFEILDIR